MAEAESRFVVQVGAEGVDETKRKLTELERAVSNINRGPAAGFAAAAAGLEKMSVATTRLVANMERLESVMRRAEKVGTHLPDGARVVGRAGAVIAGRPPPAPGQLINARPPPAAPTFTHAPPRVPGTFVAGAPQRMTQDPEVIRTQDEYDQWVRQMKRESSQKGRKTGYGADFGMGLIRSALPGGQYVLGTGGGALATSLGIAAGSAAANFARLPLSGAGGLGGALSMLGPAAIPFQRFLSRSESAMSMQGQQLQLAPLLGNSGVDLSGGLPDREITRQAKIASTKGWDYDKAVSTLEGIRRQRVRGSIADAGRGAMELMGASVNEGQTFRSQLAAAGGNRGDQMSDSFVNSAMAAQTNYGVGAQTTGAFALAARTGAVRGGGTDANALLLKAIGQTQSLGLTGADAQNYLQRIASGIEQMQQTGMPLQMDQLREMSAGFKGLGGLSPLAAQAAAGSTLAASQAFYSQGPSSAADMMMMRAGGFTGGLDSYLETQEKLGTDAGAFNQASMKVLPLLAAGPSEAGARRAVGQFLARQGITNPDAIRNITKQARSGGDLAAAFAAAAAPATSAPASASDVGEQAKARARIPEGLVTQASMANQNLAMGADATRVTQELEASANDTANAVSKFSGSMLSFARLARMFGDVFSGGGDDAFAPSSASSVRPAN